MFTPKRGSLVRELAGDKLTPADHILTKPDQGVFAASATVQFKGNPETFKDYEVGFIQTVIADEAQADYDSGHAVIQKLPLPIRLAEMKRQPTVPAPWTALDAMKTKWVQFKASDVAYFQKFYDLFAEKSIFEKRVMVEPMLFKG